MENKSDQNDCCAPADIGVSCCKVEALVTVDERGQMVLPKETREKAKIQAGDKLAVIRWGREDNVCCLTLIKADELSGMVKAFLEPIAEGLKQ